EKTRDTSALTSYNRLRWLLRAAGLWSQAFLPEGFAMRAFALAAGGLLAVIGMCVAASPGPGPGYREDIERWRQRREAELRADDGWLTVAGLFWLRPGET